MIHKGKKTFKARDIKEFARSRGADLVGIASVERFENAPKGFHPRDIMPDVASVIVIGKHFPLGVLRATSKAAVTQVYQTMFDLLDHCAYDISSFLEEMGGQAMPIPADAPYMYWDADKREGRGDLSHRHAAVLAGLGSLGKNTLLLTPQFGNRVNLASVLANVPLEGDPLLRNDLCTPDCDRCVKACPANAIQGDGTVIQKECRKFHSITTAKGFKLFACWECRKVCPVQGTSMREPADLR
jgi:epoxyqueuosine reductase QueG